MRQVQVVFRKYDGSLHWHLTVPRLGDDAYGVWVGQPAGGAMRKGNDPLVPIEHGHVGLLPRRAGWVAWFNTRPAPIEVYCDVTTVPAWRSSDEVSMVDLDLDVCRTWDGAVRLLDEDEFAEHRVRYGYRIRSSPRPPVPLAGSGPPSETAPSRSRTRTAAGWPW